MENFNRGCVKKMFELEENKFPEYIMKKLRKRMGLDENDTSEDNLLSEYTSSQAFSEVLKWDGLLGGWDYEIKRYVKDIYNVDLDGIK